MATQNITVELRDAEIDKLLKVAETLPKGDAKIAILSAAFNLAAYGNQRGQR